MSESKKKATPKKAVEKKKETKAVEETPKAKVAVPHTLGELKKKFAADRKASPENHEALRAEYLKNKKAIQGSH